MADEIRVRIIPGCPAIVVAETDEEREAAEAALADVKCGVQVITEELAAELAAELAEEAEPEAEAEAEAEAEEELVCSLEPDKPWEESVCGVVAREAGRQAAEDVMRRIRPQIERMKRVSEGRQE